MAGVRETKWVVTIDGNAKEASAEAVGALKAMATEYETNKTALAQLNAALKASGKGTAETTKGIKKQIDQLKARQAVLTQDATKHGHSVQTIIKNAKKEAAEREKAAKKIAQAEKERAANQARAYGMLGGRLGVLRNKLVDYRQIASQEGGQTALFNSALTVAASSAMALAAGAAAAAAAVGIGLSVALAAATVSLTKWIVLEASARKQSRLQMEAWVGSSLSAKNLADQIDKLGKKVPTSTAELEKTAISLRKAGLSGAPLVDSLNAVGQAAAGLGDESAANLQSFITRYQRMGIMQINPMEMLGTGIQFDDVAGALAKQLGVSIEKARAALATGRVKLADGAKAMRTAIEGKVAGINLRKLSDLSTVTDQFGKRLSALTKDVDLGPVSRFLERIYKMLDGSSVSGQALKTLFESLATAFGTSLDKNGDWIEYGLKEAIIWSLELATQVVLMKNSIEDAFNDGRSAAEKFNAIVGATKETLQVIAGTAITPFNSAAGLTMAGKGINGLVSRVIGSSPTAAPTELPAHATGGIVTGVGGGIADTAPLPAPGEGLASVGVGEAIVPASQVRASGGGGVSISIGDVVVQSTASDPAEVADEVADNIVEKILHALEISGAQLGVT